MTTSGGQHGLTARIPLGCSPSHRGLQALHRSVLCTQTALPAWSMRCKGVNGWRDSFGLRKGRLEHQNAFSWCACC